MRDRQVKRVTRPMHEISKRRRGSRSAFHILQAAVEPLEPRTFLTATPIPIVNSDFETVYKTGSAGNIA
jgi:hypothetical protein